MSKQTEGTNNKKISNNELIKNNENYKYIAPRLNYLIEYELIDAFKNILNIPKIDFITSVMLQVKSYLINEYNKKTFDEEMFKYLIKHSKERLERKYDGHLQNLTSAWENFQLIKKNKSKMSELDNNYLKNFVYHCSSISDYATHNCDQKTFGKFIKVFDKNNNKNILKYVICENCRKSYFIEHFLNYCEKCELNYYSCEISPDKKELLPATLKSPHCEPVVNEKLNCQFCKNLLYLNVITNQLKCLNCRFISSPKNIDWKCNICSKPFQSDIIAYNKADVGYIKKVINYALLIKKLAHPAKLPCCKNIDVRTASFYHKKDCKGIIYFAEFHKKLIIICEKCKAVNNFGKFIWTCPGCSLRFKDMKWQDNEPRLRKEIFNKKDLKIKTDTDEERNTRRLEINDDIKNNIEKRTRSKNKSNLYDILRKRTTGDINKTDLLIDDDEILLLEKNNKENRPLLNEGNNSNKNNVKSISDNNVSNAIKVKRNDNITNNDNKNQVTNLIIARKEKDEKSDKEDLSSDRKNLKKRYIFEKLIRRQFVSANNIMLNNIMTEGNENPSDKNMLDKANNENSEQKEKDNNENNKNNISNNANDSKIKLLKNNNNKMQNSQSNVDIKRISMNNREKRINKNENDENKNVDNGSMLKNNNKKHDDLLTEQKSVEKMVKNSYQIDIPQEQRQTDLGKRRENKYEFTKTSSKEFENTNKNPININNIPSDQKINVKRYLFKTPNSNSNNLKNNLNYINSNNITKTNSSSNVNNSVSNNVNNSNSNYNNNQEKNSKKNNEVKNNKENDSQIENKNQRDIINHCELNNNNLRKIYKDSYLKVNSDKKIVVNKEYEADSLKKQENKENKQIQINKNTNYNNKNVNNNNNNNNNYSVNRNNNNNINSNSNNNNNKYPNNNSVYNSNNGNYYNYKLLSNNNNSNNNNNNNNNSNNYNNNNNSIYNYKNINNNRNNNNINNSTNNISSNNIKNPNKNNNSSNNIIKNNNNFNANYNNNNNNNNNNFRNNYITINSNNNYSHFKINNNFGNKINNNNSNKNIATNNNNIKNNMLNNYKNNIINANSSSNKNNAINSNSINISVNNNKNNIVNNNTNKKNNLFNNNYDISNKVGENAYSSSSLKRMKSNQNQQNIDEKLKYDNNTFKNRREKNLSKIEPKVEEEEEEEEPPDDIVKVDKIDDMETIPLNPSVIKNPLLFNNIQQRIKHLLFRGRLPLFNVDNYTIQKTLGEGTNGVIYHVVNNNTKKNYAMKKLIASTIAELDFYQKEFQICYDNPHQYILNIYGVCARCFDSTTYVLYVLMALAQKDLEMEISDRIKTKKYFQEKELISMLRKLVSALYFLQKERNVAHRDIKPENILLFKNGVLKLADFGEAKVNDISKKKKTIRGTEFYMSPLLYAGNQESKYDIQHNPFKSDVFSLGYCFIYASCLDYEIINEIRKVSEQSKLRVILKKHFPKQYSSRYIDLLLKMITTDENQRVDFIGLQSILQYF